MDKMVEKKEYIFELAKYEDIKYNNKKYLRLDCKTSNIKLNKYYKSLGFQYVETIKDELYVGNKREKII